MRFLIGITTGAILTLFIATSLDGPVHPTLELARAQIERLWNALIDTTSDSLFKVEEARVPEKSAALETAPHVPVTRLEAPEQLPPPPPAEALPIFADQAEPEVTDPSVELDPAIIHPPTPELEMPVLQAPLELAAVWVPFHSQMSAEGFAARLSRELDHTFRVERQGAGAYQVVFDATSPIERDTLLTQIEEITGR